MSTPIPQGLGLFKRFQKRSFDILFSSIGLVLTWWIIVLAVILATLDTREFGLFMQKRVGRWGNLFTIYKIRTMKTVKGGTSVTTRSDPRITPLGNFFRRTKIDELPQLVNVLIGKMSFVGPRPDVPGYADKLQGNDRIVLSIRPGITGPATLKFRNEEELLAECEDPEIYNRDVVFPEKVRLNVRYVEEYSLVKDIKYILETVLG